MGMIAEKSSTQEPPQRVGYGAFLDSLRQKKGLSSVRAFSPILGVPYSTLVTIVKKDRCSLEHHHTIREIILSEFDIETRNALDYKWLVKNAGVGEDDEQYDYSKYVPLIHQRLMLRQKEFERKAGLFKGQVNQIVTKGTLSLAAHFRIRDYLTSHYPASVLSKHQIDLDVFDRKFLVATNAEFILEDGLSFRHRAARLAWKMRVWPGPELGNRMKLSDEYKQFVYSVLLRGQLPRNLDHFQTWFDSYTEEDRKIIDKDIRELKHQFYLERLGIAPDETTQKQLHRTFGAELLHIIAACEFSNFADAACEFDPSVADGDYIRGAIRYEHDNRRSISPESWAKVGQYLERRRVFLLEKGFDPSDLRRLYAGQYHCGVITTAETEPSLYKLLRTIDTYAHRIGKSEKDLCAEADVDVNVLYRLWAGRISVLPKEDFSKIRNYFINGVDEGRFDLDFVDPAVLNQYYRETEFAEELCVRAQGRIRELLDEGTPADVIAKVLGVKIYSHFTSRFTRKPHETLAARLAHVASTDEQCVKLYGAQLRGEIAKLAITDALEQGATIGDICAVFGYDAKVRDVESFKEELFTIIDNRPSFVAPTHLAAIQDCVTFAQEHPQRVKQAKALIAEAIEAGVSEVCIADLFGFKARIASYAEEDRESTRRQKLTMAVDSVTDQLLRALETDRRLVKGDFASALASEIAKAQERTPLLDAFTAAAHAEFGDKPDPLRALCYMFLTRSFEGQDLNAALSGVDPFDEDAKPNTTANIATVMRLITRDETTGDEEQDTRIKAAVKSYVQSKSAPSAKR